MSINGGRIREAPKKTGRVYFELIEPVTEKSGDAGWAYATRFTINRPADAHEEVSFNLDVDDITNCCIYVNFARDSL